MPGRRLRSVPAERVVRAFLKVGYSVSRISGGHSILVREASPVISIPYHGNVKIGLLLAKIRAASITYDEFEALL